MTHKGMKGYQTDWLQVTFRVTPELKAAVDKAKGLATTTAFIVDILKKHPEIKKALNNNKSA